MEEAGKKLNEERDQILAICHDLDDEAMIKFPTERMDELKVGFRQLMENMIYLLIYDYYTQKKYFYRKETCI